MSWPRVTLVTGTVVAGLMVAVADLRLAVPAGAAENPGDVRAIGASSTLDGAALTIEGRPAGSLAYGTAAAAVPLPAGRHEVTVDSVATAVDVVAGCTTNVVAAERPFGAPPELVPVVGCTRGRIPTGAARLTVLVASDEPGRVRVSAGGSAILVDPFAISPPLVLPAGPIRVELAAAASGIVFTTATADLAEGTAGLAVFSGGGERPFRLFVTFDGAQATTPPAGVEINTGAPVPTATRWLAALLGATAAAAAAGRPRCRRTRAHRGRRHRQPLALALLVLTLAPAACAAFDGDVAPPSARSVAPDVTPHASDGRANSPTTSPERGAVATSLVIEAPAAVGAPARVRVPSLEVDAPVIALDAAEASALPDLLSSSDIGWFRGTAPGAIGTATLAGHTGASGVFGRLAELAPGSEIVVTDEAGQERRFVVRTSAIYDKRGVPAEVWEPVRTPALVMISCTGPRRSDGLHRDNVVIWADAVP
jgi:sortase (surface protein transpeptidase)